jgi:hypothetical protein
MEQRIYARWLDWGTRISLAVLVISFLAYLAGAFEPLVPLERLPDMWTLPAERYLELTGAPSGWQWLFRLDKSDYLNLVGVSLLALVTAVCYLRVLVFFLRSGERLHAAIAALQVLVLLAAASGLQAGH